MAAVFQSNVSLFKTRNKTDKRICLQGVCHSYSGKKLLPSPLMHHWPEVGHMYNSRPIAVGAGRADQTG